MWLDIKKTKKFTSKEEIDSLIGYPKFQIVGRPLYYYGEGFFVSYSTRCFKIDGTERVEYGDEGEYAVSVYHFSSKEFLMRYLKLDVFEPDDIVKFDDCIIEDAVYYSSKFNDIHELYERNRADIYYREGETRVLIDGKLQIQNLFISFGLYTLLFSGKSKNSNISGFQFSLNEE